MTCPTSPEDRARLAWLHLLPCCAPGHRNCGPVEVHHDTQDRALGKKAPHDRGMPMCHLAQVQFHGGSGPFKGWDKARRREWQTAMVAHYQALWERRRAAA